MRKPERAFGWLFRKSCMLKDCVPLNARNARGIISSLFINQMLYKNKWYLPIQYYSRLYYSFDFAFIYFFIDFGPCRVSCGRQGHYSEWSFH